MNKVSLIIGGTHGIGKVIAFYLRQRGDNVYTISRKSNKNSNFKIDLSLPEKKLIEILKKKIYFKIDNLIFSQRYRGIDFDEEYKIMIKSSQLIIETLKNKFKKNSSIILLSSIAVKTILADQNASYHIIRGGIDMMAKYYSTQLSKSMTRVNAIMPTKIFKPSNIKFFKTKGKDELKLIEKITPLNKMGSARDIAYLVDFLTSEKSRFINGLSIPLDGGLHLKSQEGIARFSIKEGLRLR